MDQGIGWNRREFVGVAAFAALALGVPAAGVILSDLDPDDAPSDHQLAIMNAVSGLVFPSTDTLGAAEAEVGAFVALALAHGLDGSRAALAPDAVSTTIRPYLRGDGSLDYVHWLENTLDRAAGGDWLGRPDTLRTQTLAAMDAEAYAKDGDGHPWRMIKGLIVTGYYTSEIGGAQELRYAPVPGRFDPAVPMTPDYRAYSNDWTGVDFG